MVQISRIQFDKGGLLTTSELVSVSMQRAYLDWTSKGSLVVSAAFVTFLVHLIRRSHKFFQLGSKADNGRRNLVHVTSDDGVGKMHRNTLQNLWDGAVRKER
jgi:hypothetical protein